MAPQRPVEMTVVEALVELALSDKSAAEELVSAAQAALEDNAVMMAAVEPRVDLALPLNLAQTEFVLEQLPLIVLEESVDQTEPEETADPVPLAKDAELVNASATTTVTRETVGMQFRPMELILVCAHKDLVEPAPTDLPVEPTEDAQPLHLVPSQLLSSIVPLEEPFLQSVQSSSLVLDIVQAFPSTQELPHHGMYQLSEPIHSQQPHQVT